jgi:hypothetical protein
MRADDVYRFLDTPAAGDNVFGDNEALVRPDLEAAPQDETARVFLDKNVAFAECASHLLSHDNSAKSRGNDRVAFDMAQLVSEPSANVRRHVGVLEEEGALEELPAVQTRPENEMPVQERAGFPEEREQILAH